MDYAMLDPTMTPSRPPPTGVIPNFVHPASNAHISVIVTSIMLPLVLVFVSLRVYSNLWINRRFAGSDCKYSLPPAYVCLLKITDACVLATVGH